MPDFPFPQAPTHPEMFRWFQADDRAAAQAHLKQAGPEAGNLWVHGYNQTMLTLVQGATAYHEWWSDLLLAHGARFCSCSEHTLSRPSFAWERRIPLGVASMRNWLERFPELLEAPLLSSTVSHLFQRGRSEDWKHFQNALAPLQRAPSSDHLVQLLEHLGDGAGFRSVLRAWGGVLEADALPDVWEAMREDLPSDVSTQRNALELLRWCGHHMDLTENPEVVAALWLRILVDEAEAPAALLAWATRKGYLPWSPAMVQEVQRAAPLQWQEGPLGHAFAHLARQHQRDALRETLATTPVEGPGRRPRL